MVLGYDKWGRNGEVEQPETINYKPETFHRAKWLHENNYKPQTTNFKNHLLTLADFSIAPFTKTTAFVAFFKSPPSTVMSSVEDPSSCRKLVAGAVMRAVMNLFGDRGRDLWVVVAQQQ